MKWLLLFLSVSVNAATYTVTDYGAVADVTSTTVTTTAGSYTATTASGLGAGAINKIINIYGGGAPTDSNHRLDLVAQITNVSGTTISLNRPAGYSTNSAVAYYGTCSSTGFQSAINLAGVGDTVAVPAGSYLVIPPVWNTNWLQGTTRFNESAVTISKSGISIVGTSTPILVGNGAFQLTLDGSVYRGHMFNLAGPFTNGMSSKLTIDGFTMDGKVAVGRTSDQGFPANVVTGDGWDITHDAIWVGGSALPFATNTAILNCNFQNWRGEMLKSSLDERTGDLYGITNCVFRNGNASGNNIQFGHSISGCTFTNLDIAMESYMSTPTVPSYFLNNSVTNCRAGIVIQGALTTRQPTQPYLVANNVFQSTDASVGVGPSENLTIRSNYFHSQLYGLQTGISGGQGNVTISNIVFVGNVASNLETYILIASGKNMYITNNFLKGGYGSSHFGDQQILGGSSNIWYVGNSAVSVRSGLESNPASSMFPWDDPSNNWSAKSEDDFFGTTNGINYAAGRPHQLNDLHANTKLWLVNTNAAAIPVGAQLVITNSEGADHTIYLAPTATSPLATIANGSYLTAYWSGSSWSTNAHVSGISGNLVINGNLIIQGQ